MTRNGGKCCIFDPSLYLHAGADLPHHTGGSISALDNVPAALLETVPSRARQKTNEKGQQAVLTLVVLCNRGRVCIILLQEEDELIEEWQPEPLVPSSSPADRTVLTSPVVTG